MNSLRFVRSKRRGNVVVLSVLLLIGMVGMVAFSLDLGFIFAVKTEMQRSADSAALAATWRLLEEQVTSLGVVSQADADTHARATAVQFAGLNHVSQDSPGLAESDVVVGHYMSDGTTDVDPDSALYPNAVKVRVQKSNQQNGRVRLFFARALGVNQLGIDCDATAAFWGAFRGFQLPEDGSNLGILPITLDRESYEYSLLGKNGPDNYSYNPSTGAITEGPDGIPEVNLYPEETGAPGNRGTVDFGNSNNATPDLERQILNGLSESDLAQMGGNISFDANGQLILNGDTGISAALKTPLSQIRGQPRMIPIFDSVSGNGNNANYTITEFTGIRIMHVKLTGAMKSKTVVVQPAVVVTRGGIRDDSSNRTNLIFSPVALVD